MCNFNKKALTGMVEDLRSDTKK